MPLWNAIRKNPFLDQYIDFSSSSNILENQRARTIYEWTRACVYYTTSGQLIDSHVLH